MLYLTPKDINIEKVKCKAYCEGYAPQMNKNTVYVHGRNFKYGELEVFYHIRQELNELFDLFSGLPIIVSGSYIVKKILEFYYDEPVLWDNNDIDIFCYNTDAGPEIMKRLAKIDPYNQSHIIYNKFKTPFGILDFIFNQTFTCPEEILNSFDFVACAVGITETSAYIMEGCMYSLMDNNMSKKNINLHRVSSSYILLKRIEKYVSRGFCFHDNFESILFRVFDKYKDTFGHNYWDKPNGTTIKSNYDNKKYIQVHERIIFRHDFISSLFSASKKDIRIEPVEDYAFLDVD